MLMVIIILDLQNKSIAVVGNAQYLFNRKYGKEIDSHNYVIRMNRAAILCSHYYNYYTHGSKTNIWAVWRYDEYENIKLKNNNMNIIQMAFWYGSKSNNILVYKVDMILNLIKILDHTNPSTGLMVLDWISYYNPSKVSVYGFDWKETPTFTDINRIHDNNISHNYKKEKILCEEYYIKQKNYIFRF
jgi:hypothetical protein